MHVSQYASLSFELKYVIFVADGDVCLLVHFGFVFGVQSASAIQPE
jgi:hypothetical protein